jgi:hypothetical protein
MTVRSNPPVRWAAAYVVLFALLVPSLCAAEGLCPRVKHVTPGDKRLEVGWTMGVDERDIEDFGGYRVWIREVWRGDTFDLAREYIWGEDDTSAAGYWSLEPFYEDSIRVFAARSVQNAFPYEFSVTTFKASNPESVNYDCIQDNRSGVVYPREGVKTKLAAIQVIPNPYRSSADWEYAGERRVAFVRLPSAATIRIYTAAAEHVRTLRHENPDSDQEFWDLKNEDGEEVAPGVYIWGVDADGIGTAQGKMLILK